MVYRKFRTSAIIHILLLAFSLGLLFFLVFRTRLYAACILLGLMVIYQVYSLLHLVNKTNRDLARFFQSVKYGDFTQAFKEKKIGSSFEKLHAALTDVMEAFLKARAEKEEQYLYLQTVVQHVGIGLVVFQPDGEVDLINAAAKRLFRVAQLKNIKALEPFSANLVKVLLELKPKERALVRIEMGDEVLHLSLFATEFKLHGQKFTLVSIQNIQSELEEQEIEAWQKLIRVLTHEIMNSVTPIASLASTISGLIKECYEGQAEAGKGSEETLNDIHLALQTIRKRSQGLLRFVEAYRNLARIPRPNFQIFPVQDLLARVEQLLRPRFAEKPIRFQTLVKPSGLELMADPELMEQVLINLLVNAVEAVQERENPIIEILAFLDERGRTILQVKDNGVGIAPENLDKVFIPFFSTKEGGTGIGLSLSRQIMRLHNGSISVASEQNGGTILTLRFSL